MENGDRDVSHQYTDEIPDNISECLYSSPMQMLETKGESPETCDIPQAKGHWVELQYPINQFLDNKWTLGYPRLLLFQKLEQKQD